MWLFMVKNMATRCLCKPVLTGPLRLENPNVPVTARYFDGPVTGSEPVQAHQFLPVYYSFSRGNKSIEQTFYSILTYNVV